MIVLKKVVRSYQVGDLQINALQGLTLEVNQGNYMSIVGPSGSGKSTLFHVIGGLEKVDSGEVWVDGQPIHQMNDEKLAEMRRKTISFVFQQFLLLPTATVLENVMMPLLGFLPSTTLRIRAKEVLERVGLGNRIHHLSTRLSGGEQQRVAIARSLITKPQIILADEPTGNLDSENSANIIQLLEGFCHQDGGTLIIITHDRNLAERANEEIELLDGQIIRHNRRIESGSR